MKTIAARFGLALLVLTGGINVARADQPEPAEGTGSFSSGLVYTSGTYGSRTTTTIRSVPLTAVLSSGDFTLDVSVPYLNVNGDPNVIPGLGKVNNKNPTKRGKGAPVGSAAGFGDLVAALTYDLYSNDEAEFGFDVTGSAKLATGDSTLGLGSGANDYTAEMSAYKALGPVTFLATVGYSVLGSTPYIKLRKHAQNYSLGALFRASRKWSIGLTYATEPQSPDPTSNAPARDLTAILIWELSKMWSIQGYAIKGMANGSPDTGGGATLKFAF